MIYKKYHEFSIWKIVPTCKPTFLIGKKLEISQKIWLTSFLFRFILMYLLSNQIFVPGI